MRHGSLFSGIGGFDLAAQWMGWENVFQVEWDGFCQKVLAKNFPNVKRYGDIKEFDGTEWKGRVDIISGGFPCQPFSNAGNKKGKDDDRYLWPEYIRVVREIKPFAVTGENVTGIIDMELDNIITDLENEGYTTEQFIIPACSLNAPHRRDRVWIVAYAFNNLDRSKRNEIRGLHEIQKINRKEVFAREFNGTDKTSSNGNSEHSEKYFQRNKLQEKGREITSGRSLYEPLWNRKWIDVATEVYRMDDGLPFRLDRLKSLGNAIVPQVAYQIFKSIEQINSI